MKFRTVYATIWVALCLALWTTVAAQQTANTMNRPVVQTMGYLLYLPDDYDSRLDERFPLVLFLHGGGEGGSDLERVKTHGLPKLVAEGRDFPFILVSPQNPSEELLWPTQTVAALLGEVIAAHRVDEDRVYLTGLSRGGFGAWAMAMAYPERFAAVVPVAGGGVPNYVDRIGEDVPVWAFHGARDGVIPLSSSVEMIEALQQLERERDLGERELKLTVYPEANHQASWERAYTDPGLYRWLLRQSR